MSYSQNNEEAVITDYFKGTKGHFLDIGAYDGKTFSNTLRLAEMGWSGVCIEPSPTVFPALLKVHGENPNITLVNAAICPERLPRMVEFYDSGGDAISTTDMKHVEKWEAGYKCKFQKFFVYMMPLAEVFTKFGCSFQFINIDVESTNHALFLELPFSHLTDTRMICVEHDGNDMNMEGKAHSWGFVRLSFNGENLILAR